MNSTLGTHHHEHHLKLSRHRHHFPCHYTDHVFAVDMHHWAPTLFIWDAPTSISETCLFCQNIGFMNPSFPAFIQIKPIYQINLPIKDSSNTPMSSSFSLIISNQQKSYFLHPSNPFIAPNPPLNTNQLFLMYHDLLKVVMNFCKLKMSILKRFPQGISMFLQSKILEVDPCGSEPCTKE